MSDLIAFFPMATTPQQTQQTATTVVERVTVQTVPSRADLLVSEPAEWSWQELRDYVVAQIEQRFGAFPRDSKKEYGIFSRFIKEHGANGVSAAKAAFEIYDGWWQGAPISINRFAKGSDPYFVAPILSRLNQQ